MRTTIRTFVAIEIPQSLRAKLNRSLENLRSGLSRNLVRWVRPDSMHLTLNFLGDIDQLQVGLIQETLDSVVIGRSSFMLEIKGFGSFPNSRRPRVLWVGIEAAIDDLQQLQSELSHRLEVIGFDAERRDYHPHLTIGRVRKGLSGSETQAISDWVQSVQLDSIGRFEVDSISLKRSVLEPSGAVYTNVYSVRLAQ
ncbi:MAG: RNA 2',3'-cyclic phosphodiesterase [Anaerolineales bacterium]